MDRKMEEASGAETAGKSSKTKVNGEFVEYRERWYKRSTMLVKTFKKVVG